MQILGLNGVQAVSLENSWVEHQQDSQTYTQHKTIYLRKSQFSQYVSLFWKSFQKRSQLVRYSINLDLDYGVTCRRVADLPH